MLFLHYYQLFFESPVRFTIETITMLELIRPNLHVVAVHFPIALLTAGVLIEIFSFLGWRRSSF